jgi:hypothetical protein
MNMKPKSVNLKKKLVLSKTIVANLGQDQQRELMGGRISTTPSCDYTFCFCFTYGTRCC